jgi:nucleotidyltransferase/DNA polymerase involved in DNA repair
MFNALYVDLNSYFASVEQQLRPVLRGKPVGVLPVMAETTCCIAASIQAKRCKVKTGTAVREARKRCPDIVFVQARPSVYVEMHHRIVAAVESCYPVSAVLSIDEMALDLTGHHQQEKHALKLARDIKKAIYSEVGEVMHCSIGIAPNRFLAKAASNFKKPDDLEFIHPDELPQRLFHLELSDLNGIGPAMVQRLNRHGIETVKQLCLASKDTLRHAWGSAWKANAITPKCVARCCLPSLPTDQLLAIPMCCRPNYAMTKLPFPCCIVCCTRLQCTCVTTDTMPVASVFTCATGTMPVSSNIPALHLMATH